MSDIFNYGQKPEPLKGFATGENEFSGFPLDQIDEANNHDVVPEFNPAELIKVKAIEPTKKNVRNVLPPASGFGGASDYMDSVYG